VSRRPVTVVAAVLCAAALSACGTGLQNETYKATGRQDSALAQVGTIAIRNAYVDAPASGDVLPQGASATLVASFVNKGATDDALTGVTSAIAGSTELRVDGQTVSSVDIPSRSTSSPKATIVFKDLTRDVRVGEYITVRFSFKLAGSTDVQVPVRAGDTGLADREEAQDPYHKPE
jgi:copper(I)-binding protein